MSVYHSVCLHVGLLPVRGVIPDMTSDSDKYIQLHSLYREQAAVDVVAVTTHLLRLLQTIGRVAWHVVIKYCDLCH